MHLTKAEENVMLILWKSKEGVVNDIRNGFSDPKPARNTVLTVLRILEKKGYLEHKAYSNVFLYFPVISKDEYLKNHLFVLMERYFNNSILSIVSFLVREKKLSLKEVEKLFAETKKSLKRNY